MNNHCATASLNYYTLVYELTKTPLEASEMKGLKNYVSELKKRLREAI